MFSPVAGAPFGRLSGFGEEGVWHAFSTRLSGYSTGPYRSLNLGLHVGDDPEQVQANRKRLFTASPWSLDQVVVGEQVHGAQVAVVGQSERGAGARRHEEAVAGCDALITRDRAVALMALFADCAPVFFCAPRHGAIGLAHAGWRGIVAGIAPAVLRALEQTFGVPAEQVRVAIGPCIGPCCYEIGDAVAAQFKDQGLSAALKGPPWRVDLTQALFIQLQAAGVPLPHMVAAQACTHCRSDLFFSHRRDGGRTGRMAAVIGLHDE